MEMMAFSVMENLLKFRVLSILPRGIFLIWNLIGLYRKCFEIYETQFNIVGLLSVFFYNIIVGIWLYILLDGLNFYKIWPVNVLGL